MKIIESMIPKISNLASLTVGDLIVAADYAYEQAHNEGQDLDNRFQYLDEYGKLRAAIKILADEFGDCDEHHWFFRKEFRQDYLPETALTRYIITRKNHTVASKVFEASSPVEALRMAKEDRNAIQGWAVFVSGIPDEFEIVDTWVNCKDPKDPDKA